LARLYDYPKDIKRATFCMFESNISQGRKLCLYM